MSRDKSSARPSKKDAILEAARALDRPRLTPPELEQIRRRLLVLAAATGHSKSVSVDYIASVLEDAGLTVVRSARADTGGRYEEEFHELLHFATLDDAEMCLIRLDELHRKFVAAGERAAVERVLQVARLGRRRAEMIAHNHKVEPPKRAEKQEVARWFANWLENPAVFFDWLELRKNAPEFKEHFAAASQPEE